MKRNKIIAVAAVFAVGIVAWRMGAMQEAGPASAGSAASAGAEQMFTLISSDNIVSKMSLDRARLLGIVDALLTAYEEAPERAFTEAQTMTMRLPTISTPVLERVLHDLDWVLQVRSQKRADETEQQAAERIVRARPAVPFNQDRLRRGIAKLQASDYLIQPALVERYAREIADMVSSVDSMRLLAPNDAAYAQIIRDMNDSLSSYAKQRIVNYIPSLGWGEAFILREPSLPGQLVSAVFSPDGSKIVTVSLDGAARIWNALTGALEHTPIGHMRGVGSAVSPDGSKRVTISADGTARILNANTGAFEHMLIGHTQPVESAVFSPDGSKIVTASWDHTARIWDANTGTQLHILHGHTASVRSAVFSPDGARIVTASYDGTARIWNPLPSSLPGVSDLDATLFIRLLYWAHRNRQVIVRQEWSSNVVDRIQWSEVQPEWVKKMLQVWIRKTMQHRVTTMQHRVTQ